MSNFARFMQAAAGSSSSSSGGSSGGNTRSPDGTEDTTGVYANTVFHFKSTSDATLVGDSNLTEDNSSNSKALTISVFSKITSFNPFQENITTNENAKNDDWIVVSGAYNPAMDYIRFPSHSAFQFGTGDFTIETFIYPLRINAGNNLIYAQTGSGDNDILFFYTSTQLCIILNGSDLLYRNYAAGTFTVEQWHHVAFCRDGVTYRLFVDGEQIGTWTYDPVVDVTNSYQPTIGAHSYNSTNTLDAKLYNFRVSKGIARYTTSTYSVPKTLFTDDSYTSLLLTSNSTRTEFEDISSYSHTITYGTSSSRRALIGNHYGAGTAVPANGYSESEDCGSLWTMTPGSFNEYKKQYIKVNNHTDFNFGTDDFTIEFFFYYHPQTTTGSFYLIDFGQSTSAKIAIQYNHTHGSGGLQYGISSNGSTYNIANMSSNGTLNDGSLQNRWNHVVLCRSGTNISAFLNGTKDLSLTGISDSVVSNNYGPFLGKSSNDNSDDGMRGAIAQFRVTKGSSVYDPTESTISVPTSKLTEVTDTKVLLHFKPRIYDVLGRWHMKGAYEINQYHYTYLETTANSTKYNNTAIYKHPSGVASMNKLPYDYNSTSTASYATFGGTLERDFCLEFWFYFVPGYNSYTHMLDFRPNSSNGEYVTVVKHTSDIRIYYNSAYRIDGSVSVTSGNWYHFALTRAGDVLRLFVNGTYEGGYTTAGIFNSRGRDYVVWGGDGNSNGASSSNQAIYFEDIRLTNGNAIYTSAFTPPTAALPTYG